MFKALLGLALIAVLWHFGIIQLTLIFAGTMIMWVGGVLISLATL